MFHNVVIVTLGPFISNVIVILHCDGSIPGSDVSSALDCILFQCGYTQVVLSQCLSLMGDIKIHSNFLDC